MNKIIIILLVVLAVVGIWGISTYNSMLASSVAVDTQFAQVETQYQRRFDLIPNLVESVKGIMAQEKEVFEAIAQARTQYSGARTAEEKIAATNQVESALGRLLVITENYPQLRSSETVLTLMAQLEGTENRVAVERQRYNEVAQAYNLQIQRIPGSLFASIFGFTVKSPFQATEGAENAPQVKF